MPAVINPGNEPTGTIANGYPALGNIIAYNENDAADDALLVTPLFEVDQTYLNGQLDIWFDTYWRHAGGGGSKDSTLELRVNGTPYWQMTTINGEGAGSSTLSTLNGATMSAGSPSGLSNPGGGGAFSQWGNVHITIPYTANTTPQIEFAMQGQGLASDDFGVDRIYVPVCLPDRGDAPDTYGTDATAGNSGSDSIGPIHRIVNDLHLGISPDGEGDAVTPLDSTGDGADEDGVTLGALGAGDTTFSIPASDITVTNNSGLGNATLHAWIDFDGNGIFESDEYTSQTVSDGTTNGNPDDALTWSGAGVSDLTGGTTTYARFRLTTDGSISGTTPGNLASDGEVEDYSLEIVASDPNVLLVKRITAINNDTTTSDGTNLAIHNPTTYAYDDNDIPAISDPNNPAYDENDPAFDPYETDQWPTPLDTYMPGGTDGGNVMPNDEIEYTIYFLSSGDTTAENVLFCDYVPTFTSFTPNGYNGSAPQANGGIGGADLSIELYRNGTTDYHTGANDGDSATYFAPGADPATSFPNIDCDGDGDGINANTNGAVVVNLGDLPDATTNAAGAYGYVRFRTRVK